MRRLIGLVGTMVVLLAWTSCGDSREFDPEDRVGPEVGAPEAPQGRNPIFETSQRGLTTTCDFNTMPETGCPRGYNSPSQYAENGWGVELINRTRKAISGSVGAMQGWTCATMKDQIMSAAIDHAHYYEMHVTDSCLGDGHDETPGCLNFTGVNHVDRVIAHGGMPAGADPAYGNSEAVWESLPPANWDQAICQFINNAPYHRQSFMVSELKYVGTGQWTSATWPFESQAKVINWIASPTANRLVAFFPPPGSQYVPLAFDAHDESPTPPVCANGWSQGCGYAVSIRVPGGNVTGTAFCKVEANGSCTHVPHIALLASNQPAHVIAEAGTLYAHYPLQVNTVYRAQFFGTKNGVSYSPWWEFRTTGF